MFTSCLFYQGNIGSSNWGLNLLLEEGVISDIVALAYHCEVLSIRGQDYKTALLCLTQLTAQNEGTQTKPQKSHSHIKGLKCGFGMYLYFKHYSINAEQLKSIKSGLSAEMPHVWVKPIQVQENKKLSQHCLHWPLSFNRCAPKTNMLTTDITA